MRALYLVLIGLLVALQYEFWFGDVGLRQKAELETLAEQKTVQLHLLAARNQTLRSEVLRLKASAAALEDRARYELGMIREDEVFYFVPGTDVPGTDVPGTDVPGTDLPSTATPGIDIQATNVTGAPSVRPGQPPADLP